MIGTRQYVEYIKKLESDAAKLGTTRLMLLVSIAANAWMLFMICILSP